MRPCYSFLRHEGVLGIGHVVVVLFRRLYLFAISASYAIDDVGGGAREVISDLNGSLGSRYFLGVVTERTSFASCASAFKSAGLVINLE